jgi:hypothetical protein
MIMTKMICRLRQMLLLFSSVFFVIFLSGCISMVHDMQVGGDYADFNATLKASVPISSNMSRVIIYYPRLPLALVSLSGNGGAFIHFELENSEYLFRHTMWDQVAVYLDVVPGTYTFHESITKKDITIFAQQGTAHYIKICANAGVLNYDPPVVVDQTQALAEIEKGKMRGNLNNPLLSMVPKVLDAMTESPSMPASVEQSSCGKLYVFWVTGRPVGSLPIKLGLDSQTNYKLKNKKYCCITASAGRHVLTSAICPPFFSKDDYQLGHLVEIKQNEDTYVMYYSKGYIQEYQLKYLTQDEGQKFLKKYKLNKNGYLLMK